MRSLNTDILIPFKLHLREKCDNCVQNLREVLNLASALIQIDGIEYISFNTYSAFMHDTLYGLREMSIESRTAEDYSFYASHSSLMIDRWKLFCEDILDMAADPLYSDIKNDLFHAWDKIKAEVKELVDHFVSAHEALLQMDAPAPSIEILKAYRDRRQSNQLHGPNTK